MSRLILIGGGELKERQTLIIDEYIASEAKKIAGERRASGLFLPTASHDCMPYYNTFHKVYTGLFDIRTDVALTVNREVDPEKMKAKFEKADFLYIGGGDTVYMLRQWKQSGLLRSSKRHSRRGSSSQGFRLAPSAGSKRCILIPSSKGSITFSPDLAG